MLNFAEVAILVPQRYMRTDVVQGDTTLFKEFTREETYPMRWLCLQEHMGTWRCAACNKGKLTIKSKRCGFCNREVEVRYF